MNLFILFSFLLLITNCEFRGSTTYVRYIDYSHILDKIKTMIDQNHAETINHLKNIIDNGNILKILFGGIHDNVSYKKVLCMPIFNKTENIELYPNIYNLANMMENTRLRNQLLEYENKIKYIEALNIENVNKINQQRYYNEKINLINNLINNKLFKYHVSKL